MRALIAQLAAAMITPMTSATTNAATMTAVIIGTAAVIGQKDPSLVNITAVG